MFANETNSLVDRLCNPSTQRFFEFGSGGSTLAAAFCNVKSIVSVDSDFEWLRKVASHVVWRKSTSHLQQLLVDLGPVRAWGYPAQNSTFGDFQHYARAISRFTSETFDVVLVDGRFRVASALWAIPRLHASSELIIHDYERTSYHILNDVLELKWAMERLVAFRLPRVIDVVKVERLIRKFMNVVDK
jgi:protein O-GlcNAc transferase